MPIAMPAILIESDATARADPFLVPNRLYDRRRSSGRLPMHDRVVLVAEGSHGVGAATSRLLGSLGATVVVHYQRDRTAADEARSVINAGGGRALIARANLTLACDVAQMASMIRLAVGDIDTVIVNPSAEALFDSALDLSFAAYEHMLSSETAAATHLCRAFAPAMRVARTGWVVAVGSEVSQPCVDEAVRIASHAALHAVIRAITREVGSDGIGVSSVAPGCTAGESGTGARYRVARSAQAANFDVVAAAVAAACNSPSHLSAAKIQATNSVRLS